MKNTKIYGIALITGTLSGIITMIFHPTGNNLLSQPDEIARRNEFIAVAVHTLAIMSLPCVFFGLLGFCYRLGLHKLLVSAALVIYGFGATAAMLAAVINGLVGPVLTRKILETDEPTQKTVQLILMNNHLLNQGLTKIYVGATAFAVIAWSVSLWNKGKLMRSTAAIGLIVGILSLLGIFSGHLKLDVHGFGLFTFALSVWLILVGIFMFSAEIEKT